MSLPETDRDTLSRLLPPGAQLASEIQDQVLRSYQQTNRNVPDASASRYATTVVRKFGHWFSANFGTDYYNRVVIGDERVYWYFGHQAIEHVLGASDFTEMLGDKLEHTFGMTEAGFMHLKTALIAIYSKR